MFQRLVLTSLIAISCTACSNQAQPLAGFPRLSAMSAAPRQTGPARAVDTARYIAEVASAFHEAWRAGRRKPDGSYEPRLKETKDPAWIKAHGGNQVDIANTTYPNLPTDWQAENRASAEIAVQQILAAAGTTLSPAMIEQGSNIIHIKWLERNQWAKGGDLDKPYAQLPEPEKQKDREALYQAIHKGLELSLLNAQQVSPQVSQAIQQMLNKGH